MLQPTTTTTPNIHIKPRSFIGNEPPKKRHKPNLNAFKDEDDEITDNKYVTLHNALMATVAATTSFGKNFQAQQANIPPPIVSTKAIKPIKPINTNYAHYKSNTTTNTSLQADIFSTGNNQSYIKPISTVSKNMNVQNDFPEISSSPRNSPISNSPVSNQSIFFNEHSHQYNNDCGCNYSSCNFTNNKYDTYYNNNQTYAPMKTCSCDGCKSYAYKHQTMDPNAQSNYYNNQQNAYAYSQKQPFQTSTHSVNNSLVQNPFMQTQ